MCFFSKNLKNKKETEAGRRIFLLDFIGRGWQEEELKLFLVSFRGFGFKVGRGGFKAFGSGFRWWTIGLEEQPFEMNRFFKRELWSLYFRKFGG